MNKYILKRMIKKKCLNNNHTNNILNVKVYLLQKKNYETKYKYNSKLCILQIKNKFKKKNDTKRQFIIIIKLFSIIY